MYRVQSAGAATTSEPTSSRNRERFLRGPFLTAIRYRGGSVAREGASALRIDDRGRSAGHGLNDALARTSENARPQLWTSSFVRRTEHLHLTLTRSEPCRMAQGQT
jgi:hypothetical protein